MKDTIRRSSGGRMRDGVTVENFRVMMLDTVA